jgi:serine/threonine-protein kinase
MTESPAARPVEIPAGTLLAGDFAVEFKLGEGGMGAVYAVLQKSTGVRRALKVMGGAMLQNPRAWERFEHEARVCARIRSEHVVKVISAGIEPRLEIPFLVMELLEGEPLDARLLRGAIPPAEARLLLAQLCHGLAEMHQLGIVHRDVKPENIFIARSHRVDVPFTVKLLDFGLAKTLAGGSSGVTQAVGTPRTMAPEQADPRLPISPATDVWALGLTAFHLLSGRSFWLSTNHAEGTLQGLLAELLNLPIPPASQRALQLDLSVQLPPGFDPWLLRCLQRDPSLRFPDAAAAWAALAPILGGEASPALYGSSSHPVSLQPAPPTDAFAAIAPPDAGVTPWDAETAAAPVQGEGVPGLTLPSAVAAAPAGGRRWRLLAGVAVAAALGGGWFLWARERTLHCRSLLQTRSDVLCVGELEAGQELRRAESFRLRRFRGKARSAERVNGTGALLADGKPSAWIYGYDPQGVLSEISWQDNHRRLLVRMASTDGGKRFVVLGRDGHPRRFPGGQHEVESIEHDARGLPVRVVYMTTRGDLTTDEAGAFGYEMSFDPGGNMVRRVTLGHDRKPAHDRRWIERIERVVSPRGDELEVRFLSHQGAPQRAKDGCATLRQEFDAHGNVTRLLCLDALQKPTLHEGGFHGWAARHDERGNRVELRYLGLDGATTLDASGVAIERTQVDARGRPVEVRFFKVDGSPTHDAQGVGGWKSRFDERGDEIERVFVDPSGAPSFHRDGHAILRKTFDLQHCCTEMAFLDPGGAPVFHQQGYAGVRLQYDEFDQLTSKTLLDEQGQPTLGVDRYATVRYEYDPRGLLMAEHFLNPQGKPVRAATWQASTVHRYDAQGNEVETLYLGPDGKPTYHQSGYSVVRRSFNARNEVVSESFLNTESPPRAVFSVEGVQSRTFGYDALGRQVAQANLDGSSRQPIPDAGGVVQEVRALDERGRVVERTLLDTRNNPARGLRSPHAIERFSYNERGQLEEQTFFDEQGKPCAGPSGAHRERFLYDAWGNRIEQSFWGEDGAPAKSRKEEVARLRWGYEPRGQVVEWSFLDGEGKLALNKDGYAVVRTTLDKRGHQIEWVYLDEKEHPLRFQGYARSTAAYDLRGQRIEARFLDETGTLVTPEGKQAPILRFRYDERGNLARESFWRAEGQAGSRSQLLHRDFLYDDRDLLVEIRSTGVEGQPGQSAVRIRYDEQGRRVGRSYHDEAGRPSACEAGYSAEVLKLDERGRLQERLFQDAEGKPAVHREKGAARLRYGYDGLGRLVTEELYDTEDRLQRTNRFRAD